MHSLAQPSHPTPESRSDRRPRSAIHRLTSGLAGLTLALTGLALAPLPATAAPAAEATRTPADVAPAALAEDPTFAEPGARFTLGVLPDTQFYSRYSTEATGNQFFAMYGSEPFNAQTEWLVDNDQEYGTVMSMHLGDVVDRYNVPAEWGGRR